MIANINIINVITYSNIGNTILQSEQMGPLATEMGPRAAEMGPLAAEMGPLTAEILLYINTGKKPNVLKFTPLSSQ